MVQDADNETIGKSSSWDNILQPQFHALDSLDENEGDVNMIDCVLCRIILNGPPVLAWAGGQTSRHFHALDEELRIYRPPAMSVLSLLRSR